MLRNLIMWHLSLCDDLEHPGQALRFPQRSVGCFLPETELVAHWAAHQWERIPVKVRSNSFPSGHLGTWKKMKFWCSAPSHHWKYLNTSRGGSRCQVFPAQKGLNDHLLSQLGVLAEGVLNQKGSFSWSLQWTETLRYAGQLYRTVKNHKNDKGKPEQWQSDVQVLKIAVGLWAQSEMYYCTCWSYVP